MRLKQIKINKDYLIFKKDEVFNFNLNNQNDINQKFNVIIGSNGSGKTLLMSMITNFFHNIDRYHFNVKFDIEITYEIPYLKSSKEVVLKSENSKFFISVNDEFKDTRIIPRFTLKERRFSEIEGKLFDKNNETHFLFIRSYLPLSIVLSIFSIHGEYPNNRPKHYLGEKNLKVFDVSQLYGNNHFGLPTITRGITRFLKLMFDSENQLFKHTIEGLGFVFNNRVEIYVDGENIWVDVNKANYYKLVEFSEGAEGYLNDLEFLRNGKIINFSNMSTGEKMLIYRILSILSEIENNSLVIVEEPEMHLDFSWNRQLISLFDSALKEYNAHIIFVTHNPYLINSLNQNQILFLKNGVQDKIQTSTFQLTIEELFIEMFGEKFALNSIEIDVMEKINSANDLHTIKEIYASLGNSIYKYLAFQKIQKLKGNVETN